MVGGSAGLTKEGRMNTYSAYYKGKKLEVEANTAYEAQLLAAKAFNAKKAYDVSILLIALNGHPVSIILS